MHASEGAPRHSEILEQEAIKRSPLLAKFLQPIVEEDEWRRNTIPETEKLIDTFDKQFETDWGIERTNFPIIRGREDGIFPESIFLPTDLADYPSQVIASTPLFNLRLLTAQMIFVGWQLEPENDLIHAVSPKVAMQVASLSLVNEPYRYVTSDPITKYVNSCLAYGATMSRDHKDRESSSVTESLEKQAMNPPSMFADFIETLDIDDFFTGKRE